MNYYDREREKRVIYMLQKLGLDWNSYKLLDQKANELSKDIEGVRVEINLLQNRKKNLEQELQELKTKVEVKIHHQPMDIVEVNSLANLSNSRDVIGTKYDVEFTEEMMNRVKVGWLSDPIINFYCGYLSEVSQTLYQTQPNINYSCLLFNTYFYYRLEAEGYSGVKEWLENSKFLDFDKVLFPINLPGHWVLAVINFGKRRLEYYDSISAPKSSKKVSKDSMGNTIMKKLLNMIVIACQDNIGTQYCVPKDFKEEFKKMQLFTVPKIPKQTDADSCGLFVCWYMKSIVVNCPFRFSQRDMKSIRKRMESDILTTLKPQREK